MKHRLTLSLALFAAAGLPLLRAEPAQEPPAGGTPLLPPDAMVQPPAKTTGKEYGSIEVVPVEGEPFKNALRAVITAKPVKEYAVQAKLLEIGPIAKNDVLLASFYARVAGGGDYDTGAGAIGFDIQVKGGEWEAIAKFQAAPSAEWQRYFVPFQSGKDAPTGAAQLAFSFGAQLQTVEVGGLEVINYGSKVALRDLPITEITYAGREPDAPWRKAAEERIEKIRKADFVVTVKDSFGHPVPGVAVSMKMKRHAFEWGATLNPRAFAKDADGANWLKYHKELFNFGVAESTTVWSVIETPKGKIANDKTYEYFAQNHQGTRAHVLLYERADVVPPDVAEMAQKKDADRLRERIATHIKTLMAQYKGKINEWVVENEAVDNHLLRQLYGDSIMAEWFKLAREADPHAKLMINENHLEGQKPDKLDPLLALCQTITKNGGPLDVIGIQGHVGGVPNAPEKMLLRFDKLAATGKALAITEFDFHSDSDPQLKADYTRDMMTAVFSHPSFNNFTIWKWWDGQPTKENAVIYSHDWTLKPSGQIYKDLVFKKWWTNLEGQADAAGRYAGRGFLGEYEITATANGKTMTVPALLRRGAQPSAIEITLK